MTRFEDCFPPDIVRAVYARLEREETEKPKREPTPTNNVVSLSAYRLMRETSGR
jgi:hypothetical protein